jgi:hypothetical protein
VISSRVKKISGFQRTDADHFVESKFLHRLRLINASILDRCALLNEIPFSSDSHRTVIGQSSEQGFGGFMDVHHFFELKTLHQLK